MSYLKFSKGAGKLSKLSMAVAAVTAISIYSHAAAEEVSISEVQGNGDESPLDDQEVTVTGIVTGLKNNGFFVQSPDNEQDSDDATSDGVFVFGYDAGVAKGDSVTVTGDVSEYYGNTQISADNIEILSSNNALPTAVIIPADYAEVDFEALEGMLVTIEQATVTDNYELPRYGEILVAPQLLRQPTDAALPLSAEAIAEEELNYTYQLLIEDSSSDQNPDGLTFLQNYGYDNSIKAGDTVTATGPINYSYDKYRINVDDPSRFTLIDSGRHLSPDVIAADISIATFNVLNYFNGVEQFDDDGNYTGQSYSENARGVDSEEMFEVQEGRIIQALAEMNADVVGLVEIENDGFGRYSAIQQLVTKLNEELINRGLGGDYAFVDPGVDAVGSDEIAVGFIYKTAMLEPTSSKIVVMPNQVYESFDKGMRDSLVTTFSYKDGADEFALAVNHFKSKGSGCYEDVDDYIDGDELYPQDTPQNNCNAFRVSGALALGDALASDSSLPEKVFIVGDINAYSKEDPISVLTEISEDLSYGIMPALGTEQYDSYVDAEGNSLVTVGYGYTLLGELFDADGVSYSYDGLFGSLDHILANDAALATVVDAAHWNVNSFESGAMNAESLAAYYTSDYHATYYYDNDEAFASSDHDPMIATLDLNDVADSDGEVGTSSEDDDDNGGSLGIIVMLLSATLLAARRKFVI